MNKYIDADKLIAEIEKLSFNNCKEFGDGKDLDESFGSCEAYNKIHDIITSLQQESKDKDVFIQKAIQWMCKTAPIDDVLSVEMIEDFKKTMMEE